LAIDAAWVESITLDPIGFIGIVEVEHGPDVRDAYSEACPLSTVTTVARPDALVKRNNHAADSPTPRLPVVAGIVSDARLTAPKGVQPHPNPGAEKLADPFGPGIDAGVEMATPIAETAFQGPPDDGPKAAAAAVRA